MIKEIITWPNKLLSRASDEVDDFDYKETPEIITDLWETLMNQGGVGLSAIQIGVPLKLFILDKAAFASINVELPEWANRDTHWAKLGVLVFINPKIIEESKETDESWEGCLSFPEVFLRFDRPKKIRLSFMDEEKEEHEVEAEDFLARAILHENDHLNGTVFLKYVGRLKREMVEKKLRKRRNFP